MRNVLLSGFILVISAQAFASEYCPYNRAKGLPAIKREVNNYLEHWLNNFVMKENTLQFACQPRSLPQYSEICKITFLSEDGTRFFLRNEPSSGNYFAFPNFEETRESNEEGNYGPVTCQVSAADDDFVIVNQKTGLEVQTGNLAYISYVK